MPIGRVTRTVGGFFYVTPWNDLLENGSTEVLECAIRGKLKNSPDELYVGDKVEYSNINGHGVITTVLPRDSELKRPYIANVNLLVLVFAHQNPDPNDLLIAKFLVLAETSRVPYLIIFNKTDLVSKSTAKKLVNQYQNCGFQVICTSITSHTGKNTLQKALKGKVSVFAGPSGVGKSALVNLIAPGFKLQTGSVSEKIGRGKHTTREVQLMRLNSDSFVADTPGFSQITLDFMEPSELAQGFFDFQKHLNSCKFKTCLHQSEPGCRIKMAVTEGEITQNRYQCYLDLLSEVKQAWANRYR